MEKKIDEAAVWKRVTATSAAAPEKNPPPAPETELLSTLAAGHTLEAAFSALGNRGRKLHTQLAQEQKGENTTLKSLYFLKTGNRPWLPGGQSSRDPRESYVSRLRWLLDLQAHQQEALERLAQQADGQTAAILSALAGAAAARWGLLLEELGKALEKA